MKVVPGHSRLVVHTALANGRFTVLDARRERPVVPLGAHSVLDQVDVVALLEQEEQRAYFDAVMVLGSAEEAAAVVEAMQPFFGVRPRSGPERTAQVVLVPDVAAVWPPVLLLDHQNPPPPFERQLFELERTPIPHLVAPGLYLGDWPSVTSLEVLRQLGVTGVVNASNHFGNKHIDELSYLSVNVDDYDVEQIDLHFDRVVNFVDRQPGATVVHCAAGVSRSATLVVACLMLRHGLRLRHALTAVHSRRGVISPNRGFLAQLLALEARLQGGEDSIDEEFVRLEDLLDYDDPALVFEHGLVVAVKQPDGHTVPLV